MSQLPTIVIVPTSWQTRPVWELFQAELENAGYPQEIVEFPSVGETATPLATLDDDIAAVQAVLKTVETRGEKALLLCHGFGGLAGSHAVEGHPVEGIIYISGLVVPKGKSILDVVGGEKPSWMEIEVRTFP
jgi:pimeloyl-ACP methyl ester carboxylesterase